MKNSTLTIACLCLGAAISSVPAQSLLPFPAWAQSYYDAQDPSANLWTAPDWALVDAPFHFAGKHENRRVGFGDYQFGMRSTEGTIAVWHWTGPPLVGAELGGISSGLDRIIYMGMSDPGDLFPAADKVLVWTGFTAANVPAVAALPLNENVAPDPASVIVSPIANAVGQVWTAASIVANGVGILDGVTGNVCWLEWGTSLHPGIVVSFPAAIRKPIYEIVVHDTSEIELRPYGPSTLGAVKPRLVISGSTIIEEGAPPPPEMHTGRLAAGSARCIAYSDTPDSVFVQARSSSTSAWSTISGLTALNANKAPTLLTLNRPLVAGEEIRLWDLLNLRESPIGTVVAETPIIFSISPQNGTTVTGGTRIVVEGANFVANGIAPVVQLIFTTTLVSYTDTQIILDIPANAHADKWPINVTTGDGGFAASTFEVE